MNTVAEGDVMPVARRALLELLQAELLTHIGATVDGSAASEDRDAVTLSAPAAAALSKELRAVTAELESLAPAKESTVDDLASKRAARRATAAG